MFSHRIPVNNSTQIMENNAGLSRAQLQRCSAQYTCTFFSDNTFEGNLLFSPPWKALWQVGDLAFSTFSTFFLKSMKKHEKAQKVKKGFS